MVVYNSDLFDADTVARLAASLDALLRAAVARPDLPVVDLDLLGDAGRARVLALARPDRDDPTPGDDLAADGGPGVTGAAATLADLVAPHAAATPDAPAVVCGADAITYRELDRRANRLAHWLRGRGVGPTSWSGCCWNSRWSWP